MNSVERDQSMQTEVKTIPEGIDGQISTSVADCVGRDRTPVHFQCDPANNRSISTTLCRPENDLHSDSEAAQICQLMGQIVSLSDRLSLIHI